MVHHVKSLLHSYVQPLDQVVNWYQIHGPVLICLVAVNTRTRLKHVLLVPEVVRCHPVDYPPTFQQIATKAIVQLVALGT